MSVDTILQELDPSQRQKPLRRLAILAKNLVTLLIARSELQVTLQEGKEPKWFWSKETANKNKTDDAVADDAFEDDYFASVPESVKAALSTNAA